jgi:hypothetical protein
MDKEKLRELSKEKPVQAMVEIDQVIHPEYFDKSTPLVCLTFGQSGLEIADVKPIVNKKGQIIELITYPDIKRVELFSVPKFHGLVTDTEGIKDNLLIKIELKNGEILDFETEAMNLAPVLEDRLPELHIQVADRLDDDYEQ